MDPMGMKKQLPAQESRPLKNGYFEDQNTPAMQVQTLLLEGLRVLWVENIVYHLLMQLWLILVV